MIFREPLDQLSLRPPVAPLTVLNPQLCYEIALSRALQGVGSVGTNPPVGAVFVDKDFRFLGAGGHMEFGKAHAEVNALEEVRANGLMEHLKGGTLFCTLEPCCHQGKTPPCTDSLKGLGLKSVVVASLDPNPKVLGQGKRILEASGTSFQLDPDFHELCGFLHHISSCLTNPDTIYIGLKAATTLNGAIARIGDKRQFISCKRSLEYAHWLRIVYEGIAIGAHTLILDNPTLNVRHSITPVKRHPVKIVFDPTARGLLHRPLSQHNVLQGERCLWLINEQTLENLSQSLIAQMAKLNAKVLPLPESKSGGLCIASFMKVCRKEGVHSVLLEGGQGLWSRFLDAKKVDRLHLVQCPVMMGPTSSALQWTHGLMRNQDVAAKDVQLAVLDKDLILEANLRREGCDG